MNDIIAVKLSACLIHYIKTEQQNLFLVLLIIHKTQIDTSTRFKSSKMGLTSRALLKYNHTKTLCLLPPALRNH